MNQQDTISVGDSQANSLPLYYRQNFFSKDTLFYTERTDGQFGVAGDPVPYTVRGDDLLSSLLLICFIFFVISISKSQRFIVRQFKDFFYISRNDTNISETSVEFRFQFIFVILMCLMLAVGTYQYTIFFVTSSFVLSSNFQLVALFFLVFIVYFTIKSALYSFVNTIFFGPSLSNQWQKTLLFVSAVEGVLLFPMTMVLVYFDLSPRIALYYFIFIFVLLKFLTIYKCWTIFFSQKGGFLQTILYFCTLEIVPLLNLVGGILILIDVLKFNF